MSSSVIKNDKSPIKSMTFTATTSANRNISFIDCGLNTDYNLVVAVSAYITAEPTSSLICMPYRHTSGRPLKINGAHVTKENSAAQPVTNTEISGTIYYIRLS